MPYRGFQCAIDVRVSTIVVAFDDRSAPEAVYCVRRTAILSERIYYIFLLTNLFNRKISKTLFTTTDDELLVEEVGKNRELYDSPHKKHKDVNFKDIIWNNLYLFSLKWLFIKTFEKPSFSLVLNKLLR